MSNSSTIFVDNELVHAGSHSCPQKKKKKNLFTDNDQVQ